MVLFYSLKCSFQIQSSCTFVVNIWRIHWILQWKNSLSLFKRAFYIDHFSHPCRNKFIGIARNRRYLLQISKCSKFQICFKAPIDLVADVTWFSIFKLIHRLKFTKDPRYLKWWQKVTELSSTLIGHILLSSSYHAPSLSCLVLHAYHYR